MKHTLVRLPFTLLRNRYACSCGEWEADTDIVATIKEPESGEELFAEHLKEVRMSETAIPEGSWWALGEELTCQGEVTQSDANSVTINYGSGEVKFARDEFLRRFSRMRTFAELSEREKEAMTARQMARQEAMREWKVKGMKSLPFGFSGAEFGVQNIRTSAYPQHTGVAAPVIGDYLPRWGFPAAPSQAHPAPALVVDNTALLIDRIAELAAENALLKKRLAEIEGGE